MNPKDRMAAMMVGGKPEDLMFSGLPTAEALPAPPVMPMPMFDQAGPAGFAPAARQFADPVENWNLNALRDARRVPKAPRI